MLRIQTQEYITGLSDADLIEYARIGDYEPEAIAFAKAEIERRNIDPQQMSQLTQAADEHIKERNINSAKIALRPLSQKGRIIAFVAGCFGILVAVSIPMLIASDAFGDQRRKRADLWRFTFYGIGTSILWVITVAVLHLPSNRIMFAWLCYCLAGIVGILLFPPSEQEEHPAA